MHFHTDKKKKTVTHAMHVFSALGKEIEDYRQKQKKKKKKKKAKQNSKPNKNTVLYLVCIPMNSVFHEEDFNLIVVLLICLFHII